MPWHVEKNAGCPGDKPWAVVKDGTAEVEGCHASEADANTQLAALYASEPDAALIELYTFGAVGSHSTATSTDAWDSAGNVKRLPSPMTEAQARSMFAWIDDSQITDGKVPKTAGKFPHHEVSADGAPGAANLAACSAGIAVLNGGRGGANIPSADRQGVYNHLAKHLRDAGKTPPEATFAAMPTEMPMPTGMPMATGAPDMASFSQGRWRGVLAVEGVETGDGREFAANALTWRELPLSLTQQVATAPGHENAVIVGNIEQISRDGSNIIGEGRFDMAGAAGREAHRQVFDGMIRGLSVTLDDVKDSDVEAVWPDTPDGELAMAPERVVFHHGRIMDVLLTSQPAMQEAFLELVPDDEQTTTPASAMVAAAPVAPPASWFDNPHLGGVTPMTVEDDGRIYGHLASWGTCHTSFQGTCVVPPHESDFAYFTTGELVTLEGQRVPVGQLTLGTGHAPQPATARPAAAHYEHTGHAVADVTAGADAHGIWVAGAVRPDVNARTLRVLRASGLSGDWRRISGSLRLVAALVVNVPGFPIPRTRTYTHNGEQQALVAAGVVVRERLGGVSPVVVDLVARSIGRDRQSRRAELHNVVHPSAGNL